MNTVQLIAAALAAVGGLGGIATMIRASAQNRLDDAASRKAAAEADAIAVDTARDLIAQVREEMDRRVHDLSKEVSRLEGRLDAALEQRDHYRRENEDLRRENDAQGRTIDELRRRVTALESRVRELGGDVPTPA